METADFIRRLENLEADNRRIHESRHELNERLFTVIDEERSERMELEKTVGKLALSVQRLVDAMSGGDLGGDGVMSQLKKLRQDMDELKSMHERGRGMLQLAAWTGALLGAWHTVREVFGRG